MKKRLLSVALALAMLLGTALPVPAFAQEEPGAAAQTATVAETAPNEDKTAPAEGEFTPAEGETAPAEDETTPNEGETAPAEGETTPNQDKTAPAAQTSLLAANDGVGEPVTYLTWDEAQRKSVSATCSDYTALSDENITTTWGTADTSSWYVLDADATFGTRITLQGDVRLILCDGFTLTAEGGIGLSAGSSLTIYGQTGDTGTLIATAADGDAGIGGNSSGTGGGDITICGGTVEATGGATGGAGIGSGRENKINIEIIIYGGTVKATGGTDAAGIGSGLGGSIGYITLAGGTIEAAHGEATHQDISSGFISDQNSPYDVGPGWKGSMKARMSFVAGSGSFGDDESDTGSQSGSSSGTTYSRYVVNICGGNLYTTNGGDALTTKNPYNGNYGDLTDDSKAVYCAVADLGAAYANQPVSGAITVDGEEYLYNFNGVRADANGKLHLYLFAGEAALSVDGIDFEYTGTIDADNHTLQPTLGGTIYFNETTPYQDKLTVNTDTVTPASYRDRLTYTWYRCDDSTGANATLIEDVTGKSYTLTTEDVSKYIKVEASAAGFEDNPLSTVSHQVGSDTAANILRITGATLDTKAYDGTGDWNVQNVTFDTATLAMGEDYTATASIEGDNYGAGGSKKVTVTVTLQDPAYTFEGDATEATYTLTGQTVVPATLTVVSATAVPRKADGTTTVKITGVTLHGVVEGEDVSVDTAGLTGELSGSEAGTYNTVSFTQDLTLTGADAANYTLTQPTGAVTLDPPVELNDGVYLIQTEEDLFWFAGLVNGTLTDGTEQDLTACAKLAADITISEGRAWTPIGINSGNKYTGTFDGDGHTINNLKMENATNQIQGFVGYLGAGGAIQNLTLGEDCVITAAISGSNYAGGICGLSESGSAIENCTFSGTITYTGDGFVGGICGYSKGPITNCHNTGTITAAEGADAGGICGYIHYSTVQDCTNKGAISSDYRAGGICAAGNNGQIVGCTNSGAVHAVNSASSYVGGTGGICGSMTSGQIETCKNSGAVTGGDYVGGIHGYNSGTINSCYSTGTVNGSGDYVGGVCGANKGTINSCYSIGTVTVTGTTNVGDVCGFNSGTGTIQNCYWQDGTANGIGSGTGASENVDAKTENDFKSGAVCWLLNGSTSENVTWYQTLGEDDSPVLDSSHGTVYYGTNCKDEELYSNTELDTGGHSYDDDGFCTECGQYEPAVWNEENNRYEISNAGQLFWFAALVNGDNTHADFDSQDTAVSAVLMNDIDLNKVRWAPIGTSSTPYIGTFDGQNHTISGLYVYNSRSDYQGFVGYLGKAGTIQNLTLGEGCSVTGSSGVGGVCGYNGGAITGCTNNGAVEGYSYLGGICGYNYGTVRNCTNSGTVAGMVSGVGGICGYNSNIITNCHNSGTVKGTIASASNVGGVCGSGNTGCTISYCWNSGTISNKGDTVGGVCGYSSPNQTIQSCYSTGIVTGGSKVGGICGYKSNLVSFQNCYWLDTSASMGCGNISGTVSGAEPKTAEEFASGEVAYLLNGSSSNSPVWFQNLDNDQDKDTYPVLDSSHGIVYRIEANPVFYSNGPNSQPPVIVSVDITWGELSFTYSDGTWNPDTHEYDGEGWTVDEEGGNSIKVENTGNTDVNVTYEYKAEKTGITGSFTDGENPVSSPVSLPENDSSTVYLILAGKPGQELEKATIGSVTVTIGGESE